MKNTSTKTPNATALTEGSHHLHISEAAVSVSLQTPLDELVSAVQTNTARVFT